MNRILACDLDGVIFHFEPSYVKLFQTICNVELPKDLNYDDFYWERNHVTKAHENVVWKHINGPGNYSFWRDMAPYDYAQAFLADAVRVFNDIYFITARGGPKCKEATEHALEALGVIKPQVITAYDKVPHLIGIGATDFLDDRDKNFDDVLNYAHDTKAHGFSAYEPRLWMLDRPWNRHYQHPEVKRIKDVNEIL